MWFHRLSFSNPRIYFDSPRSYTNRSETRVSISVTEFQSYTPMFPGHSSFLTFVIILMHSNTWCCQQQRETFLNYKTLLLLHQNVILSTATVGAELKVY